MNAPSIILIGGGGHCISCIDVIQATKRFTIAGIIDVQEKIGTQVLDIPVIGTDRDIPELKTQYNHFFITLGQVKTAGLRKQVFYLLQQLGVSIPVIISPNAYVSAHAKLGAGTIVMHHAVVNAGAAVGDNVIINTKALVEHEVSIGDHSHISTSAVCNGQVKIGAGCFIGSNAVIRQNLSIGDNAVIGAGSVVTKNIMPDTIAIGNPAREKK